RRPRRRRPPPPSPGPPPRRAPAGRAACARGAADGPTATAPSPRPPAPRTGARSPLGGDLVARAPDGLDRAGVAQLAPQLAHVDVDRAGVAEEGEAPDPLEQLLAGEDQAPVLDQRDQQVELLGGQRDGLAV